MAVESMMSPDLRRGVRKDLRAAGAASVEAARRTEAFFDAMKLAGLPVPAEEKESLRKFFADQGARVDTALQNLA